VDDVPPYAPTPVDEHEFHVHVTVEPTVVVSVVGVNTLFVSTTEFGVPGSGMLASEVEDGALGPPAPQAAAAERIARRVTTV
jgi:hypothetical protein